MNWQPIETVPEDIILVIGGQLKSNLGFIDLVTTATKVGYMKSKSSHIHEFLVEDTNNKLDPFNYEVWVDNPTHWMPLPEPPAQ